MLISVGERQSVLTGHNNCSHYVRDRSLRAVSTIRCLPIRQFTYKFCHRILLLKLGQQISGKIYWQVLQWTWHSTKRGWGTISVTRLGNLLHFGQVFKACGHNYFAQIANIFRLS